MSATWRGIAAITAVLAPLLALAAEAQPVALNITAHPREMRLAEGGRARVRIVAGEMPVLTVSAGRLEGLREIGSGIYEAEYVPPDSVDPLVAILTATAQGRFAWTTIILAGVREVVVRAPHRTLVSVQVADEVFGPIPADGLGRAVLRVDVPPGVRFATRNGSRIRLDVPERGYSHVALERANLEANVSGAVKLRVIALDETGAPLRKPQVKLEPSEGSVGTLVQVAPGVLETEWNVEPGRVRTARLSAKVVSKPSSSAVAALQRIAGEPVAVEIDVDRDPLVAGEGDELVVTGRVVDAAGNPTDVPANLIVTLRSGEVERLLEDAVVDWQTAGGVHVARVLVPRQRTARMQLNLKVVAPGGLVGTRSVTLAPGPAAAVRVVPDTAVYADGRARQLRVVLLDKYGNQTEGEGSAIVTAARGSVGTPTRTAPGIYSVEYRSAVATADYSDVVKARVGPLEGQTELRVRALGAMVVFGAKGGYARTFDGLGSASVGAELGLWRRSLASSFGFVLETSWSSIARSDTLSLGGSPLPVKMDATFVSIEPSVAWRRPLARGMLWLAAGPGYTQVSSTVSASGQPDAKTISWVPSAHGSIGFGLPVGPGIPFAELKLRVQDEADDAPVRGAVQTYTVNVGYRFDVF